MDHVCRCLKCGYVGLRRKSSPGLHTVRDCNGQMEFVNLTVDEYYVIAATKLKITRDNEEYYNFFRYMIELKQNELSKFKMEISEMRKQIDPKVIEVAYQLRNNSFSKNNSKCLKCPSCSSVNVRKIDFVERAGSVAVFGLLSKKIGKSFKCRTCGYTW